MEYELKSGLIPVIKAEKECDVYCDVCRKLLHVQEGQTIPRCCGRPMRVLDEPATRYLPPSGFYGMIVLLY